MGLVRVSSWESILAKQIINSKNKPFKYGSNDCTTWAVKTLKLYSNLDWKPCWTTKKEALAFHKEKPMEDRVTEVLGQSRGNILLTQRGDLVQVNSGMKSALGICIGIKVVFLYKKGICYVDLKDCVYSWRI
jgi:hypothetical protein